MWASLHIVSFLRVGEYSVWILVGIVVSRIVWRWRHMAQASAHREVYARRGYAGKDDWVSRRYRWNREGYGPEESPFPRLLQSLGGLLLGGQRPLPPAGTLAAAAEVCWAE